jgi:hypothetical protein
MSLDDLSITSDNNTDKIVYESDISSRTIATSTSTTRTHDNPYGKACFVTLAWSVDNTNFYPSQAILSASNPYTANAWADASTVYVYLENFSGGNATFYYKYVLDTVE